MVLVDPEPVIADRLGIFELVEIGIVDLVPAHRVIERARDVDPHRAVFLAKILRQIGPRHQIEPDKAHAPPALVRDPRCYGSADQKTAGTTTAPPRFGGFGERSGAIAVVSASRAPGLGDFHDVGVDATI